MVAEVATAIEERVLALERRLHGEDLRPAGRVRITTADTLMASILPAVLRQVCVQFPDLTLELTTGNAPFDLSRREADVAIRAGGSPPGYLVGRKLGTIASTIYTRRQPRQPRRPPASAAIETARWVMPDDSLSQLASYRWIVDAGLAPRAVVRARSLLDISHAIRAGLGIGILPCYLGDSIAELQRVVEPLPALVSPLWMLTHADLQRVTRIRAVMDSVPELVRPLRPLLAGHAPRRRR